MNHFDTERLCRLDGKNPTARERWIAFHRLYRLAKKKHDLEAGECWRVLMPSWRIIRLEEASDDLAVNYLMPKEVRRRMVEINRAKREGKAMSKLLAAIMTPVSEETPCDPSSP